MESNNDAESNQEFRCNETIKTAVFAVTSKSAQRRMWNLIKHFTDRQETIGGRSRVPTNVRLKIVELEPESFETFRSK